jgi:hypothetical protein
MSGEPKTNVFDVVFEAVGRNTAKYRNDIAVHMPVPSRTYERLQLAHPYPPRAWRYPTRRFALAALNAGFAQHCRRSDALG